MKEKKNKKIPENKITRIYFGDSDSTDDRMDEFLKEEMIREADEIEERLNSDPDMFGVGASDDMFLKIVAELKEKGIWEEEPQEGQNTAQRKDQETGQDEAWEKDQSTNVLTAQRQQELIEKGLRAEQQEQKLKEKKARRARKMKRAIRRGSVAAAMVAVVFGVGMTSEANRRLVFKAWDAIAANVGIRMATDYIDEEKTIQSRDKQEIEDAKRISEELDISSIDFAYLPEGMEYLRCEIDEAGCYATMFFSYNEKIFTLEMIKIINEGVAYYSLDSDPEMISVYTEDQEIEAKIGKVNNNNDLETYIAQLEFNDCNYVLNGWIPLEEMKKIVEKIYFL